MIGGTSWHSTLNYYRYINRLVNDQLGTDHSPELIIHSIDIQIMHSGDWDLITEKFISIARSLEGNGAEAIILCANTTHRIFVEIQRNIDIPVIHIADAIADEAKNRDLSKLGLIGTKPTMAEPFLKDMLINNFNLEVVLPQMNQIDNIHKIVVDELVQGIFSDESRRIIISEMDLLCEAGAQAIILGCTEFPILLQGLEYKVPLLDTAWLHAKKSVDFILSF